MKYMPLIGLGLAVIGLFTWDWFQVGYGVLIFLLCFLVDYFKETGMGGIVPMASLIGGLLLLAAPVLSTVFGFNSKPFLLSVSICAVSCAFGWMLARIPQVYGFLRDDGSSAVMKILVIQFLGGTLLASVFYGVGYGVHKVIS